MHIASPRARVRDVVEEMLPRSKEERKMMKIYRRKNTGRLVCLENITQVKERQFSCREVDFLSGESLEIPAMAWSNYVVVGTHLVRYIVQ